MDIANSNAVNIEFLDHSCTHKHTQFTDMHRNMTESSLIGLNIAGII